MAFEGEGLGGGRGSGSPDHLVRDVRSGATTSRPVFIATHALDHN